MKKRNTGTGRQLFCIRTRARALGKSFWKRSRVPKRYPTPCLCGFLCGTVGGTALERWNATVTTAWDGKSRNTPVVVAIVFEAGQKDRRHEPCARGHAFELQRLAARLGLVRHAVYQTRQAR